MQAMFGLRSWQYYNLSHEDTICYVDSLSSEDVAVVVDFHWFTDCHLEAIFNMNSSRLRLDLRRRVKMFVWSPVFLTESDSARYCSAPSITTVWSNCRILYNDWFKVYITKTVTYYHQMFKWSFDQFNSLDVNHVTSHSSFSLVNRLQLTHTVIMTISM